MADNDDNRPGLGTAAAVAGITAVGTAGVALASGKMAIRDGNLAESTDKAKKGHLVKAKEAADMAGLEESAKFEKAATAEEKALFGTHTKGSYEKTVEALKKHAADVPADKAHVDSLLTKMKPVEEAGKTFDAASKKLESAQELKAAWKEAGWAERLTKSIAHSPKKIALLAAPVIAAGSVLGISQFSGRDQSELSGNTAGRGPAA